MSTRNNARVLTSNEKEISHGRVSWQADNLKKVGWSYGYVSAVDSQGRTIWIVDAHCDDGKRFVVRLAEKTDCVYRTGISDSSWLSPLRNAPRTAR